MHLIINGALPPKNVAPDLAPHLREHCPALIERLKRDIAAEVKCPPEETGCTAQEFLALSSLGFIPSLGQTLSSGFGPLRAGISAPNEQVWVADLCSVAIGREGAKLAFPESLHLKAEHADALFDAVKPLWADCEISALPISDGRWRVWLTQDARLTSITPAAVSLLSVSDWWPQDDSMKAWRKLLNEIQMVWHHHPVNEQRAELGLEPINSLWLYGGAKGWKAPDRDLTLTYYDNLTKSFLESDWANWIAQLQALSLYLESLPEHAAITLVGERRIVSLTAPQQRWWHTLLPRRNQDWMTWWTRQN
jgi:hypothetical protein